MYNIDFWEYRVCGTLFQNTTLKMLYKYILFAHKKRYSKQFSEK